MALDINALPLNKKFNRRLIAPDTWIINPFDPKINTGRPYVLEGEEFSVLIDPTYTTLPIRDYVEQFVTDKPLKVLCTHSHLDHTNNNSFFEDCEIFMSEYAWGEIKARREKPGKEGSWTFQAPDESEVEMTPEQIGTYVPTILKPGDKIDLGNRVIEVLPYVGCHSEGSLIYFDHNTGIMFTGDEIECGQMLVMGQPGTRSCVEQLRENIQTLIDGWGDKVTALCPPHNGSPLPPVFLKYLLENCDRVLNGIHGEMDIRSMSFMLGGFWETMPMAKKWLEDPDILRSEWKGTSIVYNKSRLHKSDIK